MITAEIKMGNDYTTMASGDDIYELIEAIKGWNTLGNFERDFYTEKGTLEEELATGWYYTGEKQDESIRE